MLSLSRERMNTGAGNGVACRSLPMPKQRHYQRWGAPAGLYDEEAGGAEKQRESSMMTKEGCECNADAGGGDQWSQQGTEEEDMHSAWRGVCECGYLWHDMDRILLVVGFVNILILSPPSPSLASLLFVARRFARSLRFPWSLALL